MVKEAFDAALGDLGGRLTPADIDGSVISYFSDHFTCQLKAGAMVQDFVGLCPKPNIRIEGGGATGGLCFQAAVQAVASGRFDVCAAMGFETMSTVETWKGNDFIALASDTQVRLSARRFLHRLLRDDGRAAHARVWHDGGADGARRGEELRATRHTTRSRSTGVR